MNNNNNVNQLVYGKYAVVDPMTGLFCPQEHSTMQEQGKFLVHDFPDGTRWLQHLEHPGSVLRQTAEGYFHNDKELSVRMLNEGTSEGIRMLISTPRKVIRPVEQMTLELTAVPAAEAVVDAATGDLIPHTLSGFMVGQRKSDGYINATAMCQASGKQFNDYFRLKASQAFLEELSTETGIPVSGLVVTSKGGIILNQGTWVHPDVAIHLAQWCSPKFAVQVSRWVREWMTSGVTPTFQLPQTYAEALRALADSEEQKSRMALTLRETEQSKTELSHSMAEMNKAILLTDWLKQTKQLHGHGAIMGRKILAFKGLLNRAIVSGCRHSSEAVVNEWAREAGILTYKRDPGAPGVHKSRKPTKEDPRPNVYDATGAPVMIYPLVVAVTPDKGTAYLMDLFMNTPECLLRRLVQTQGRVYPNLKRLHGRYSFMYEDSSWENLLTAEEKAKVVKFRVKDGKWSAQCRVKEGVHDHRARGYGESLEDALKDLANQYYLSR